MTLCKHHCAYGYYQSIYKSTKRQTPYYVIQNCTHKQIRRPMKQHLIIQKYFFLYIIITNNGRQFCVHGSVHHKSILIYVQRDATICSIYFILLQNHSTCFGCRPHPSSGVHKTLTTATGTSHIVKYKGFNQKRYISHQGCVQYTHPSWLIYLYQLKPLYFTI